MSYFYTFQFNCVTLNILNIFDVFYQKIQKTVDETEIPLSNQNTLLYTSCHSNTQNTTTTQAKKSTFRVHFGGGGHRSNFYSTDCELLLLCISVVQKSILRGPQGPQNVKGPPAFSGGPPKGGRASFQGAPWILAPRGPPGFWPQGGPQENDLWGWGAGPIFNQRIWNL